MKLLVGLLYFCFIVLRVNASEYVLWYEKPASNPLEEALPIGNGRLGALVFGDTGKYTDPVGS